MHNIPGNVTWTKEYLKYVKYNMMFKYSFLNN